MSGSADPRRTGGPARPRLANPYDLSTWAGAGATGQPAPAQEEPPAEREQHHKPDNPGPQEKLCIQWCS